MNPEENHIPIVASFGLRGGTGKTSILWSVADVLRRRGARPLIIDFDFPSPTMQDSAPGKSIDNSKETFPRYLFLHPKNKPSLYSIIQTWELEEGITIDFIPSAIPPIDINRHLNTIKLLFSDATNLAQAIMFFQNGTAQLEAEYDYLLVDATPGLNPYSTLSLLATDLSIYVMKDTAIDIQQLQSISKEIIQRATKQRGSAIIVVNECLREIALVEKEVSKLIPAFPVIGMPFLREARLKMLKNKSEDHRVLLEHSAYAQAIDRIVDELIQRTTR